MTCHSTSTFRPMAWRCHDCFGEPVFCTHCIQQSHQSHPLHRVSRWDGTSFFPSSLSNAGLTLNLGHAGRLCPVYSTLHQPPSKKPQNQDSSITPQPCNIDSASADCGGDSIEDNSCLPEKRCSGERPLSSESTALGTKRSLYSVDISAEPSDPTMPVQYDNPFWESQKPSRSKEESLSSGEGSANTMANIQLFPSAPVIPHIDTTQDPFFANASDSEEEWKDLKTGGVPLRVKRKDRKYDALQCPILTVVDTTGIHEIRTRFCRCRSLAANPLHDQLLDMGLYPSSTQRTSTVFTFRVLHHFDLTNLEGKTTAWQYYSTLRRLSSNVFSDTSPDRYRELMRALRQWRDLGSRRRAGLPFEKDLQLKPGGLALFCPACPQPGVNLPEDWMDDPQTYVAYSPHRI